MAKILDDILLLSCLAAFLMRIVLTAATLLG
jgi:hypothetical protein